MFEADKEEKLMLNESEGSSVTLTRWNGSKKVLDLI